jgi:hypothetical protein
MKYLKINNIYQEGETRLDYKTLDIEQFVPGSQVYPIFDNFCLVKTRQDDYPIHPDIEEITEQEYNDLRNFVMSENERLAPPSPESILEQQQQQIDEMTVLLGDLMLGGGAV